MNSSIFFKDQSCRVLRRRKTQSTKNKTTFIGCATAKKSGTSDKCEMRSDPSRSMIFTVGTINHHVRITSKIPGKSACKSESFAFCFVVSSFAKPPSPEVFFVSNYSLVFCLKLFRYFNKVRRMYRLICDAREITKNAKASQKPAFIRSRGFMNSRKRTVA